MGAALPVVASGGAGSAAQSERRTESASAVHISDVSVVEPHGFLENLPYRVFFSGASHRFSRDAFLGYPITNFLA